MVLSGGPRPTGPVRHVLRLPRKGPQNGITGKTAMRFYPVGVDGYSFHRRSCVAPSGFIGWPPSDGACPPCSAVAPQGVSRTASPVKPHSGFYPVGVDGYSFHHCSCVAPSGLIGRPPSDGACPPCSAVAPQGASRTALPVKPHSGFTPVGVNGYSFHRRSCAFYVGVTSPAGRWSAP